MTLQAQSTALHDGAGLQERPNFAGDSDDGPLGKLWVPRADAAELSPYSIDTLNRRIATFRLRLRTGPGNVKFVFLPDLAQLGLVPREVAEPAVSAASGAELVRLRAEVLDLGIRLGAAEAQIRVHESVVELLNREMEKKDKLLTSLARTNENLSGRRTAVDVR